MAAVLSDAVPASQERVGEQPNDQSTSYRLSPAFMDFAAGAVAGALAIGSTQPLDIVRIRLQQSQGPAGAVIRGSSKGAGSRLGPSQSTVWSTLTKIVRTEGVASLYKGMAFPLTFASLQSAILFQSYGFVLRWYESQHTQSSQQRRQSQPGESSSSGILSGQQHHQQRDAASSSVTAPGVDSLSAYDSKGRYLPTPWQGFVAGCTAGLMQVFMWSPIELVKVRMQLQAVPPSSPDYLRPSAMVRHILRTEGPKGLFRGFTVTTLRDIPSYGVYFGMYHLLVGKLEGPGVHPEDASPLTHVLAGGTSGCLAWCSIYSLDVVKSRMQATTRAADGGKTWVGYARDIWREGGVRAMTRGFGATIVRAFIMDAAAFLGYTYSLKGLHMLQS